MSKITFVIFILFFTTISFSQTRIKGKVFFLNSLKQKEYLFGVTVEELSKKNSVITDSIGYFELNISENPIIVLKQFEFITDTIRIENPNEGLLYEFELKPTKLISELVIEEKVNSLKRSNYNTINTESIGSIELKKAACCNLAESFETNNSVDIIMNDGVSGAKQISMLGLDGIYTQITGENIPLIRGLNASFGLGLVPGTWISSIDISKGAGSVVNGFESFSGGINVEFLKPKQADNFFLNIYQNSLGRSEGNIHLASKLSEKSNNIAFFHYSTVWNKNDINKDGFIDIPIGNQFNFSDKFKWQNNKIMVQAGIKGLYDKKEAGQLIYNPKSDRFNGKIYGIEIQNKAIEFFSKTALLFPNKPYRGLGWINNYKIAEQNLIFGNKKYNGFQNSYYSNLIYQDIIGDTRKKYKLGSSLILDDYKQNYNDSIFNRTDFIPGVFGEFEFDNIQKLSLSIGARVDWYNHYGYFITPKFNLRYSISEKDHLRFSIGKGSRISNIFMDNTGIYANQRKVVIKENLNPESGYTYGFSYSKDFIISTKKFNFYIDAFRTQFTNQVVADFYSNYQYVYVYNLNGISFSNTIQTEIICNINKNFEARFGYKWYDTKTNFKVGILQKPMQPNNRYLFNLAYKSRFEKWKFDFTTRYFGKSRMPIGDSHPHSLYHYKEFSEGYFQINTQVTRKFKYFETYLGIENLLNFIQQDAIVSNEKPFSSIFDATMVWGPLTGRIIYIGFRYTIK